VSGFQTPPYGQFTTRLGTVIYEGDLNLTGDTFTLIRQGGTQVPLTNSLNPQTNAFNSTITDAGVRIAGRNPSYDNALGFDIDVFESTTLLGNSETSAMLRLSTGGETFFPGVVTFATELFAPHVTATKSQEITDLDGYGRLGVGDRINYSFDVLYDGRDAATGVSLSDAVPLGTNYVPGSLRIDGATITDAADGDRGEVVDRSVQTRLGTNPDATGGLLGIAESARVTFTVQVTSDNVDGAEIVNWGSTRYRAEQTGLAFTGTSTSRRRGSPPRDPTCVCSRPPVCLPYSATATGHCATPFK
jgi:uncharacterized repeat protein (TIGR01451 family)